MTRWFVGGRSSTEPCGAGSAALSWGEGMSSQMGEEQMQGVSPVMPQSSDFIPKTMRRHWRISDVEEGLMRVGCRV